MSYMFKFNNCFKNVLYKQQILIKNSKLGPNLPRELITRKNFSYSYSDDVQLKYRKHIGIWLLLSSGMCVGAVLIGGATRLTNSGLSMVSWNLIRDMKPPINENEWNQEFKKYQNFPDYENRPDMKVEDFKFIFYMEYLHRMWGRLVGLTIILPAIFFFLKGAFNKAMKIRSLIYSLLVITQGILGWYMVKSGLDRKTMSPIDETCVSQYRLASHLSLALILFSGLLWQSLDKLLTQLKLKENFPKNFSSSKINMLGHFTIPLVFITSLSGAFVAGLRGGRYYNTYPKMGDSWIPTDMFELKPMWKNFFDNPVTAQFDHRTLAHLTFLVVLLNWFTIGFKNRNILPKRLVLSANILLASCLTQVLIGITSLLTQVPIYMGILHQALALNLLGTATWFGFEVSKLTKLLKKL